MKFILFALSGLVACCAAAHDVRAEDTHSALTFDVNVSQVGFDPNDIKEFTSDLWENLDSDNKISLYVRYTNLENGEIKEELINKNK